MIHEGYPGPKSQDRLLQTEQPAQGKAPEYELTIPYASIRIFGEAGAGKTTVADKLSVMIGVPLIKVGQLDRSRVPTDTDYRERADEYDHAIDAEILRALREATPANPVIMEANMAGVWGNVVDAERDPSQKGISILVTAAEKERHDRIRKRQNKKRASEGKPPLTKDQVQHQARRRHHGNLTKWQRLYPDHIGGSDPYQPGATDPHGQPFADVVIDTTSAKTEHGTIALFQKRLTEEGIIRRPQPIEIYPGKRLSK